MRPGIRFLVAIVALAGGCDFMLVNDLPIGRRCSDTDACPQGLICSADGQCLEPCPQSGCVGDQCGCTGRTRLGGDGEDQPQSTGALCQSDGLCHFSCETVGCPSDMRCVSGVCLPGCPDGWCPEGRTCENASQPQQAYCRD